eukprot:5728623-Alexandrium_andersonii.AAC.1
MLVIDGAELQNTANAAHVLASSVAKLERGASIQAELQALAEARAESGKVLQQSLATHAQVPMAL